MPRRPEYLAIAAALACACSSPPSVGPVADAGELPDAGDARLDAGGSSDASSGGADGGTDAGADAGWSAALVLPAVACSDLVDQVYVTPPLPPSSDAARGDVIRCAPDFTYDLAGVEAELAAAGDTDVTATTGVSVWRVAFRTTRSVGSGASSARVYLPSTPRQGPLPIIVASHPTEGIADTCAPSKSAASNRDLALPWAALGYAVIVPDFAGLGNEGAQGYLDSRDTAYSVLDGARALRKLLFPGAFSNQVVVVGYSQGGGAALSAQALAPTYGAGGDLAAVVVFAPQWPARLDSFGMLRMLADPNGLTIAYGVTKPVVHVMRTYAFYATRGGETDGGLGFPAAKAAGLKSAVESTCTIALGGAVQGTSPFVRDLIDDGLRTSLLACAADPAGTGCVEPGRSFHAFLVLNEVTPVATGAPILYVQGLGDLIMPAAEEAACNLGTLADAGVFPQVCTDASASHVDVVSRNIGFATRWVSARLAGAAPPTCSGAGMPDCIP